MQCRKQHGLQPDGSTGSQRPQAPLHPAPEHQFFRRREEQADPQQIPRPADLGRSHSAGAQERKTCRRPRPEQEGTARRPQFFAIQRLPLLLRFPFAENVRPLYHIQPPGATQDPGVSRSVKVFYLKRLTFQGKFWYTFLDFFVKTLFCLPGVHAHGGNSYMIRILTDSASDILPAEAAALNITVIPLNVTLEDGTVLRDGIDLTPSEYYTHLASCHKLPTTSQPSPELFERFFTEAAAAGDEVIGIFLSHALSGTYQCAKLAADLSNVDNVLFVDSASVCLGEALLVRLAVHLRDSGKTAGQIAAILEHAKEHLHLVAAIDDLKYLRKGGRLSAAVAVAGGMLGIKPLIAIQEGKVVMAGKARGLPGAYVALFKKIEEMGGIHPSFAALTGYTVSPREIAPLQTYLCDNLHLEQPLTHQIGCVIGTHAGPGAFGIAFFDKDLVLESV